MIQTTKLFKLKSNLSREEVNAATRANLKSTVVYWMTGSRKSILGGYLYNLQGTYRQTNCYSPNGVEYKNVPSYLLERVW